MIQKKEQIRLLLSKREVLLVFNTIQFTALYLFSIQDVIICQA